MLHSLSMRDSSQKPKPSSIKEYIAHSEPTARLKLQQMVDLIQDTAPNAQQCISYSMPAFKQKGILVYFAAYAKHIGFYPMPSTLTYFESRLTGYKRSKGAVQFPIDQDLPSDLICEMVLFRISEFEKNK